MGTRRRKVWQKCENILGEPTKQKRFPRFSQILSCGILYSKKLVHFFTNEELRLVVRGRFDKEIYFYIKQQKLDCIVKEVTEKISFGTKKENKRGRKRKASNFY